VLAYVFWHTPKDVDAARYEAGLVAFHRALAASPPDRFAASWSLRVDRPPWLPDGAAHYLDWYVVDGFAALGALNEAAVSGPRQVPHDAVAALAGTGTAGVLAHLVGSAAPPVRAPDDGRSGTSRGALGWDRDIELTVTMVDKPGGQSYSDFRRALVDAAPGVACWERQMSLGPGREYVIVHDGDLSLPWRATTMLRATVI
jgi:hypothetical protein